MKTQALSAMNAPTSDIKEGESTFLAKLLSEVLFYNMPYNQLGFTGFFNYPHCAQQFLFHSVISNDVPKSVDFYTQLFSILRRLQDK